MRKLVIESTLWDIAAIGFGLISAIAIIAVMNQINMFFYPGNENTISENTDWLDSIFQDSLFLAGRLISLATGAFFAGALSRWIRPGLSTKCLIISGSVLLMVGIIDIAMFPYPIWFIIISLVTYIPMVFMGDTFVKKIIINYRSFEKT